LSIRDQLLTLCASDLTVVEEVDTQVNLQDTPDTPARTQLDSLIAFRSPGAASEMSGTTAISSFSMVEAEFLEPKYIMKHMRKLCDSAREFLDHLAPPNGTLEDDLHNIHEIQKPDSDFTEEYRDFNDELNVHLKHYKSDEHSYIHIRAIRRVLFDVHRDVAAAQSGIDLILYLANLLVFAKQMIHSDRSEKQIWNVLRQLDNSFPSHFMRSLTADASPTSAGDSTLLSETFAMALDLRTQLAILVLERATTDSSFNPDMVISEVFVRSESSQETRDSIIRGWNTSALGGEDSALPQQFEELVVERVNHMREFFPSDDESLESGDVIDLEGLGAAYPWEATVLRLLHWVRLRHKELATTIDELGGAAAILRSVKQLQIEEPQLVTEQLEAIAIPHESPRKKRTSFARERRRSSRKFDPNAPVDLRAIDALKARERHSGVSTARQVQEERPVSVEREEDQDELPVFEKQQDESQPVVREEEEEMPIEQPDMIAEEQLENEEEPEAAGPPTSSAALLKALKEVSRPEKENRGTSIFDRQSNAQRVEFGDGFDTQPAPGPSNQDKGKQRAEPSLNKKRQRPAEEDSESDADFETEDRSARVKERRRKAPVAKKVRLDPASSAAPTSHQPPARQELDDDDYQPQPIQDESISETEAPDMTEEAPPSTYQAQRNLAMQNRNMPVAERRNERKLRVDWTSEAEDAFAEYMRLYPAKYATILKYDEEEGYKLLQDRTQVNLKDKARTMATNMIK
jgi:hypothetical protein